MERTPYTHTNTPLNCSSLSGYIMSSRGLSARPILPDTIETNEKIKGRNDSSMVSIVPKISKWKKKNIPINFLPLTACFCGVCTWMTFPPLNFCMDSSVMSCNPGVPFPFFLEYDNFLNPLGRSGFGIPICQQFCHIQQSGIPRMTRISRNA